MRNQSLTGYLLHHKAYQDSRALYDFFSYEFGRVRGVGKRGLPLFMPLQLFATGKRSLKNFSNISIHQGSDNQDGMSSGSPPLPTAITGENQYAALYLNEVLQRLLPAEDAQPKLWLAYDRSLQQLRQPLDATELRLCLRCFEQCLFAELGCLPALDTDAQGHEIDADAGYRFVADHGLQLVDPQIEPHQSDRHVDQVVFSGDLLLAMQQDGIIPIHLHAYGKLYRSIMDSLLEYKPLHSRRLWRQYHRYRSPYRRHQDSVT